jgi:hypothetical protein
MGSFTIRRATVVFEVSGVITGDLHIAHGNLTIAGQTAPGAGITLVGHMYTTYNQDINNIIIRHIRIRPPNPDSQWPANQHDAIQFSTANHIMLDHIDASHGADETIDFWGGASYITLQHSHLSFPIYDPGNGWTHNKGIINHRPCLDGGNCQAGDRTGGYISVIKNIFTHSRNRTPALSVGPAEIINNITYNGREGFVHHNVVGDQAGNPSSQFNIIGNHYIAGPSINLSPWIKVILKMHLGLFPRNIGYRTTLLRIPVSISVWYKIRGMMWPLPIVTHFLVVALWRINSIKPVPLILPRMLIMPMSCA